ncbi:hypothetical protein [Sansalvadorimonas verongulae]|uniref:hypothetical protein n=1 Tax=Sansalvadorimonas verongulae TaxID=2172824 RepID=UPI0012BBE513|nr:hypothetical protein [Sansalvadorimonas verongulae]MTI13905.1 hypothetical protein [Sansalvadorimonas verongulae]
MAAQIPSSSETAPYQYSGEIGKGQAVKRPRISSTGSSSSDEGTSVAKASKMAEGTIPNRPLREMAVTEQRDVQLLVKKVTKSPICLDVQRAELDALTSFLYTMFPQDNRMGFVQPMLGGISAIKIDGEHMYKSLSNSEAVQLKTVAATASGSSWFFSDKEGAFIGALKKASAFIPMSQDAKQVVATSFDTLESMPKADVGLLMEKIRKFSFFRAPGPEVEPTEFLGKLEKLLKTTHQTATTDSADFDLEPVSGPNADGIFLLTGTVEIESREEGEALPKLINGERIELVVMRHEGRACVVMLTDRSTPPQREGMTPQQALLQYRKDTGSDWSAKNDISILAELSTDDADQIYQTLSQANVLKDNKVETYQVSPKGQDTTV